MNQEAHDAIENLWRLTVRTRALCPHATDSAVGRESYESPQWYVDRGAEYFVRPDRPLTIEDVDELRSIGRFVNRSFVIAMVVILEEFNVVPYRDSPDRTRAGGDYAQLAQWLRHRFAHSGWEYNPDKEHHRETLELLRRLFPKAVGEKEEWVISIDEILEPLKNEVLRYVAASD